VTRLHYRYDSEGLGEDLVFRAAGAVVGGREQLDASGRLEEGARPSFANRFQARYVIRHPWDGPIACASPIRGRWGGRPDEAASGLVAGLVGGGLGLSAAPAVAPAHGRTGTMALEPVVLTPVVALGLPGRDASTDAPVDAPPVAAPAPSAPAAAPPAAEGRGGLCAARPSSDARAGVVLALAALALGLARRRTGQ
jgi:hypothetical protein